MIDCGSPTITTMALPNDPLLVTAIIALLCTLLRFSADLISDFSEAAQKSADADDLNDDDGDDLDQTAATVDDGNNNASRSPPLSVVRLWLVRLVQGWNPSSTSTNDDATSFLLSDINSSSHRHMGASNNTIMYGTITNEKTAIDSFGANGDDNDVENQEYKDGSEDEDYLKPNNDAAAAFQSKEKKVSLIPSISLGMHLIIFAYFLLATIQTAKNQSSISDASYYTKSTTFYYYGPAPLGCITLAISLGVILNIRDYHRKRFGIFQRIMYTSAAIILLIGCIIRVVFEGVLLNDHSRSSSVTKIDLGTLLILILYTTLALIECRVCPYPNEDGNNDRGGKEKKKKAKLSAKALLTILQPYFWPHATSTSATLNRIRALSTWLCVLLSKACSIYAPILLGKASTALTRFEYSAAIHLSIYYALAKLGSMVFKECQGLLYLFVAQAAFVELSEGKRVWCII